MLVAPLLGLARGVQRVAEQQQPERGDRIVSAPTTSEQYRPPIDRPPSTSRSGGSFVRAASSAAAVARRVEEHRRPVGRLAARVRDTGS